MDLTAFSSLFNRNVAKAIKSNYLASKLFETIHFPGGHEVKSIDAAHLKHHADYGIVYDVQKEIFLCAEHGIASLLALASALESSLSMEALKLAATGAIQRIVIVEDGVSSPKVELTFIPSSVFAGVALLGFHKLSIPLRLRLTAFVNTLLMQSVRNYPTIGKLIGSSTSSSSSATPPNGKLESSRFHELGITVEEYEELQKAKYLDSYRTMRELVPPNITKTSLKAMIALGIPSDVAERIWNKKILWFICMHPEDLPKIHIGDLRARYHFHGLDLTEMRAIWHCLPNWQGDNPKAEWKRDFKRKLDALSAGEITGDIDPDDLRNSVYDGLDGLKIFDPDQELNKQDTKNKESEDNHHTHTEDREQAKKLLAQWSSDTFDEIGDNNERRVDKSHMTRFPTMSSVQEGSDDDSVVGVERVQHLDRSVSALLQYGDTGTSEDSVSKDARKQQAKRDLKRRRGLEVLDTAVSSDDESARRMLKKGNGSHSSSMNVASQVTPKRKPGDSEQSDAESSSDERQQVRNEQDLDKFRSRRQKPTKRLSFHATPRSSAKTPKGQTSTPGDADNTGRSSEFSSWHDFKSMDSFYSPSPQVIVEGNNGSSAGSDYDSSSPRNVVKSVLQFDVDESGSAVSRTPINRSDVGGGSAEDTDAEAFGMDEDDDHDSLDLNNRKRQISSASRHNRLQSRNARRRPHFFIEHLHFPQAVSLVDSISAAATMLSSQQQQKSDQNSSNSAKSLLPSLLPEALKSFAASASTASSKVTNFKHKLDQSLDFDQSNRRSHKSRDFRLPDRTGIGRYKFFTAKPMYSGRVSDSDDEDTEVIGELDDFDDGDSITLTTAEERGHDGKSSKYITEDFRDNASVDDSFIDDNHGCYDQRDELCDEMSTSTNNSLISEDSIDYLDPKNLGPAAGYESDPSQDATHDKRHHETNNTNGSLSWKSYWANFRLRKYNFLSLDEEEEDRQIENEIDNFIVPDELYSEKLGINQSELPDYVLVDVTKQQSVLQPATSSSITVNDSAKKYLLKRSLSDMDGLIELSSAEAKAHGHSSGMYAHNDFDFEHFDDVIVSDVDVVDGRIRTHDDVLSEKIIDHIETYQPFSTTNLSGSRMVVTPTVYKNAISRASISPIPIGTKIRSRGIEYSTDDWDTNLSARSSINPTAPTTSSRMIEDIGDVIVEPTTSFGDDTESMNRVDDDTLTIDLSPVSVEEVTRIMMSGDPKAARKMLEQKRVYIDSSQATDILLRCVEEIDTVSEPLELLMLLVDYLGADPNVRDTLGNCPLHYLFSKPMLGRFIVSRGGDILAHDSSGDSVLQLCLDYGYDWIVPAVLSTGREAAILEDPVRAKEYSLCLLSLGGYGVKVKEFIDEGLVKISSDEALDILDKCKGNFDNMKDPVETFELLENIVLNG